MKEWMCNVVVLLFKVIDCTSLERKEKPPNNSPTKREECTPLFKWLSGSQFTSVLDNSLDNTRKTMKTSRKAVGNRKTLQQKIPTF